jgi:hypothetical protein
MRTLEDIIERFSGLEDAEYATLERELAALRGFAKLAPLLLRAGWSSGVGERAFTIMLRGDEVEDFRRALVALDEAGLGERRR